MKNVTMTLSQTVMFFAIAVCVIGCSDFHYHPVTKDRTADVGEFNGIALDGIGEVAVYLNRNRKVVVTANEDVIGNITTAVDTMGILRIGVSDGAQVDGKGPINIEVHAQSIVNIEIGGKGYIKFVPEDKGAVLSKVRSGSFYAPRLYVEHRGIGDISAENCAAEAVVVKHYGSGNIAVAAVSVLNIDITANNGEIVYRGEPDVMVPAGIKPIPSYGDAFNEELWKISSGSDARIRRELGFDTPPPDANGYYFHHTFEDGTTQGWIPRFDLGILTNNGEYKANGSRALYMSLIMREFHGPSLALNPKVFIPGNSYSFSVLAMFAEGPDTAKFRFGLQYDLDNTTYFTQVDLVEAPKGSWVMLGNKNIPIFEGSTNLLLYVEMPSLDETDGPTANFYIDDAMGGIAGTEAPGRSGVTVPVLSKKMGGL